MPTGPCAIYICACVIVLVLIICQVASRPVEIVNAGSEEIKPVAQSCRTSDSIPIAPPASEEQTPPTISEVYLTLRDAEKDSFNHLKPALRSQAWEAIDNLIQILNLEDQFKRSLESRRVAETNSESKEPLYTFTYKSWEWKFYADKGFGKLIAWFRRELAIWFDEKGKEAEVRAWSHLASAQTLEEFELANLEAKRALKNYLRALKIRSALVKSGAEDILPGSEKHPRNSNILKIMEEISLKKQSLIFRTLELLRTLGSSIQNKIPIALAKVMLQSLTHQATSRISRIHVSQLWHHGVSFGRMMGSLVFGCYQTGRNLLGGCWKRG